jgi:aminoglycoside phosphotransferase (APT) family kinase protein
MLERTKVSLEDNTLPQHDQWIDGLKRAESNWTQIVALWRSREPIHWVHGDLHMGNAMQRDDGGVCLVDLAEVRPGHWIEDALYLERMYWAREDRIAQDDPLGAMIEERTRLGLDNGKRIEDLAMARRILLAATTPAFLAHEGAHKHLNACLRVLQEGLEAWAHNSAANA